MKKFFILFFLFIPLLFCSGIEIVADSPGDDWIEIQNDDPLIIKSYIIAPDRQDINIMIMAQDMPADSDLVISKIIDNYKIVLMNNDMFKEGDYEKKLNVKIGNNVWGVLTFRREFDQFYILHNSYLTVKGNTIVYVTFFALSKEDYNTYFDQVKVFLEKIQLN
jgi:hypothetical protein